MTKNQAKNRKFILFYVIVLVRWALCGVLLSVFFSEGDWKMKSNPKTERTNPFPKELLGDMGPGRKSYFNARIMAGERPQSRYPKNSVPKTKIQSESIPPCFFWNESE